MIKKCRLFKIISYYESYLISVLIFQNVWFKKILKKFYQLFIIIINYFNIIIVKLSINI